MEHSVGMQLVLFVMRVLKLDIMKKLSRINRTTRMFLVWAAQAYCCVIMVEETEDSSNFTNWKSKENMSQHLIKKLSLRGKEAKQHFKGYFKDMIKNII